MTEEQLQDRLRSGRLSKTQIDGLVAVLEKRPELTKKLLWEVFGEDKGDSFNASWAFDHLMRKKLVYLLPHMEEFANGLPKMTSESCVRPMAHVCQMFAETYFKNKEGVFKENVTIEQLERITAICFDWLIGEHKTAAKVFAMTSLFHLGTQFDWVHTELKSVLEETIAKGSAAYKNRAKKTLDKLMALGH